MSILVVGSGIIGLNTASKLIESGYNVIVYSKGYPKDSTSNGAGGLWMPFHAEPAELVDRWSRETFQWCVEASKATDAMVEPLKCIVTLDPKKPETPFPSWVNGLEKQTNFKKSSTASLNLSIPGVTDVFEWDGYIIDCPRYLAKLHDSLQQEKKADLRLNQPEFQSMSEIITYATKEGCLGVVNCTGVGAGKIEGDKNVTPGRGALLLYDRPADANTMIINEVGPGGSDEFPQYVIPRGNIVVCGGTYQEGDWKPEIRENEIAHIKKAVATLCPQLSKAEPSSTWVGYRPARAGGIRFETVESGSLPVFHNYGHGGAGWTMFQGACMDTVKAVAGVVKKQANNL